GGDADHGAILDRGMSRGDALDLPGGDVLALAAHAVRHPPEEVEIAVLVEFPEIAAIERAVAQYPRRRLGIAEIAGKECVRQSRAHDDLAALAGWHGAIVVVPELDGEPGHRMTDGADGAVVIVGRKARGLGHPVAFPDLHAEALLEGAPDVL